MAKQKLSKSELQTQREKLKLFERLLPSLELKRQQLMMELKKAQRDLQRARNRFDELLTQVGENLPMLANQEIGLGDIVKIKEIHYGWENVVGITVPVLAGVEYEAVDYPLMTTPAWIDVVAETLRQACEQRLRIRVAADRVAVMETALRRVTQRVNLFERILIPEAQVAIKRIKVYLGELERDAVVRSKLAKAAAAEAAAAGEHCL